MAYIAFVMNIFPGLTETFINNEVVKMRQRGYLIRTYSVRKPDFGSISGESHELYRTTTYLLPARFSRVIGAHVAEFFRKPKEYIRCLGFLLTRRYDNALKDRVKSLFHFVEGVYFAHILRHKPGASHIHAHYAMHPSTISLVASRLLGIPFSFTAHGEDVVRDGLMLREKVHEAKFVITCSEYIRRLLGKAAYESEARKIFLVYHGVDSDRYGAGLSRCRNERFTFLHVDRFSPEKAQSQILEACHILRQKGIEFTCIMVGDGPLREQLENLIHNLKLAETVSLTGKVLQEEMPGYYRRADAFVLSSIRDNFPNVLLESLAAGTPVIAPQIGAIAELVEDGVNGILVQPGSPTALSYAMQRMMAEDRARLRMGIDGQALVRSRFDRERCIDRLVEVYTAHGLPVPAHRS